MTLAYCLSVTCQAQALIINFIPVSANSFSVLQSNIFTYLLNIEVKYKSTLYIDINTSLHELSRAVLETFRWLHLALFHMYRIQYVCCIVNTGWPKSPFTPMFFLQFTCKVIFNYVTHCIGTFTNFCSI